MSQYPPPVPPLPPTNPQMLSYAVPPARTDLRQIALRQRGIMASIFGYIIAAIVSALAPPQAKPFILILALAATITGAVFVFMLSLSLYSTGPGILLGLLTFVPLLGLIVLLMINGKATALLKSYNIRVGLMGADPKQIPEPGQIPLP